jgi:hypothetical protein
VQASKLTLEGATTTTWQRLPALAARIPLRVRYLALEPGRVLAHQGGNVFLYIVWAIHPTANCSGLIEQGQKARPKLGSHFLYALLFKALPAALLPLGARLLFFGVTRHG